MPPERAGPLCSPEPALCVLGGLLPLFRPQRVSGISVRLEAKPLVQIPAGLGRVLSVVLTFLGA